MTEPYPVAVVFSDAHLCERIWTGRDITGDSYFALYQVNQIFDDAGCANLVGCGDLIDKQRNNSGPIIQAHGTFWYFRDSETAGRRRFYFIQGQHEMQEQPWMSAVGEHVHRKAFELGPLKCYALDYAPREQLLASLAAVPEDTDVLFAHQVWGDFMGEITVPQGTFAGIPHVKLMVTGDFHQYMDVTTRGASGQKLRVISPGATFRTAIDEPDEHFCLILYSDMSVEKKALISRPALRLHLGFDPTSSEEERLRPLEGLRERIEAAARDYVDRVMAPDTGYRAYAFAADLQQLAKPLVRLAYSADLPQAYELASAACRDVAHLFPKEIPVVTDEDRDRERRRPAGDEPATLMSCLPGFLETAGVSHLLHDAAALLNAAEDPAAALQRIKTEMLAEPVEVSPEAREEDA